MICERVAEKKCPNPNTVVRVRTGRGSSLTPPPKHLYKIHNILHRVAAVCFLESVQKSVAHLN